MTQVLCIIGWVLALACTGGALRYVASARRGRGRSIAVFSCLVTAYLVALLLSVNVVAGTVSSWSDVTAVLQLVGF